MIDGPRKTWIPFNHLPPYISTHTLQTILYKFPNVLTEIICFTIRWQPLFQVKGQQKQFLAPHITSGALYLQISWGRWSMIKAALTKDFSTVLLYILSNTIKDDPITKITTEFVYAIHLLHHNFIPQQVILPGCECSVNSRVGTSPSTV